MTSTLLVNPQPKMPGPVRLRILGTFRSGNGPPSHPTKNHEEPKVSSGRAQKAKKGNSQEKPAKGGKKKPPQKIPKPKNRLFFIPPGQNLRCQDMQAVKVQNSKEASQQKSQGQFLPLQGKSGGRSRYPAAKGRQDNLGNPNRRGMGRQTFLLEAMGHRGGHGAGGFLESRSRDLTASNRPK